MTYFQTGNKVRQCERERYNSFAEFRITHEVHYNIIFTRIKFRIFYGLDTCIMKWTLIFSSSQFPRRASLAYFLILNIFFCSSVDPKIRTCLSNFYIVLENTQNSLMTTLPFFSLPLQYNLSTKTDTEDGDEDVAILSGKRHECRDRNENLSFVPSR